MSSYSTFSARGGAGAHAASSSRGRKRKLSPEGKRRAALLRKIGSCWECRRKGYGCDPGSPCENCKKLDESSGEFVCTPGQRGALDRKKFDFEGGLKQFLISRLDGNTQPQPRIGGPSLPSTMSAAAGCKAVDLPHSTIESLQKHYKYLETLLSHGGDVDTDLQNVFQTITICFESLIDCVDLSDAILVLDTAVYIALVALHIRRGVTNSFHTVTPLDELIIGCRTHVEKAVDKLLKELNWQVFGKEAPNRNKFLVARKGLRCLHTLAECMTIGFNVQRAADRGVCARGADVFAALHSSVARVQQSVKDVVGLYNRNAKTKESWKKRELPALDLPPLSALASGLGQNRRPSGNEVAGAVGYEETLGSIFPSYVKELEHLPNSQPATTDNDTNLFSFRSWDQPALANTTPNNHNNQLPVLTIYPPRFLNDGTANTASSQSRGLQSYTTVPSTKDTLDFTSPTGVSMQDAHSQFDDIHSYDEPRSSFNGSDLYFDLQPSEQVNRNLQTVSGSALASHIHGEFTQSRGLLAPQSHTRPSSRNTALTRNNHSTFAQNEAQGATRCSPAISQSQGMSPTLPQELAIASQGLHTANDVIDQASNIFMSGINANLSSVPVSPNSSSVSLDRITHTIERISAQLHGNSEPSVDDIVSGLQQAYPDYSPVALREILEIVHWFHSKQDQRNRPEHDTQ